MSTFTSEALAPSLATVKTHGSLHGSDIANGKRSAKAIAAEIAGRVATKSAQSLAAEELLRAAARVDNGKGTSKLDRVEHELRKLGVTQTVAQLALG